MHDYFGKCTYVVLNHFYLPCTIAKCGKIPLHMIIYMYLGSSKTNVGIL